MAYYEKTYAALQAACCQAAHFRREVRITKTALCHGEDLGFDWDGIVDAALMLTTDDFYKSMTTDADHKLWQDVYRPRTKAGSIYMKLTVVDGVLIVFLKEL